MGFWIMILSFILGIGSLYYGGVKKKGTSTTNKATIFLGIILIIGSVYLALPK